MASQDNYDNNDYDDDHRPGSQRISKSARLHLTPEINISDDDDNYEPSNEEVLDPAPDGIRKTPSNTIIDAVDYVGREHPLRPLRRSQTLDSHKSWTRIRSHPEFWWDVFLEMHKRAQQTPASLGDLTAQEEILSLNGKIRTLRHEKEREAIYRQTMEEENTALRAQIAALQKEHKQNKAIIAYLESRHQAPREEATGAMSQRATPEAAQRQTSRLTSATVAGQLHDNSKFPDAPVFSGDRAAFDSWKDKVQDKLNNSAV